MDTLVAPDAFDLKAECATALAKQWRALAQPAGADPERATMPVRIGNDKNWKRIRQGMKP